MSTLTLTEWCEDCDAETDIEVSVTTSQMREECHGFKSWTEVEVEFESPTVCSGCGEQFDEGKLSEKAQDEVLV